MTTLPTTTPMRLPRPVPQQTPLALGGPSAAAAPGGGFQMTGADVWRVIRSNLWLIVAMFIVSGIAGYGIFRFLDAKFQNYTAYGICTVNNPVVTDLLKPVQIAGDVQSLALEQKTQAQLLKQDALFVQVLQNPNAELRKTKWWNSFKGSVQAAKEDLADNFRVDPIAESKLVSIRMSCTDPKDCKTVVEDIVNQHLENQKVIAQNKQLERSSQLNSLRPSTSSARTSWAAKSASWVRA